MKIESSIADSGQVSIIDLPSNIRNGASSRCRLAILRESRSRLPADDILALEADWIVISPGLSSARRKAIREFCASQGQNCHDLREQGTLYLIKHTDYRPYEKIQQNFSG
jgi:hypothetical protein